MTDKFTQITDLRAEYVPKRAAELIPTANPIPKPILTRSKQLGCGERCIIRPTCEKDFARELQSSEFGVRLAVGQNR